MVGCRAVWDPEFWVQGLGFRALSLGVGVWGLIGVWGQGGTIFRKVSKRQAALSSASGLTPYEAP